MLTFDAVLLAADLRSLLGVPPVRGAEQAGEVIELGSLPLLAGAGLAVCLAAPEERQISNSHVPDLTPGQIGGVMFTPDGTYTEHLGEDWSKLALSGLLAADDAGDPVITAAGRRALEAITEKVIADFLSRDTAAWRLPADATWGEITIEFVSDEVVHVRFRGETRRLEPEHLGMKDQRNGRPREQWELLKIFAHHNGAIQAVGTGEHAKFVKQKQELSKMLRTHFGILREPVPYDKQSRTFRTAFVIRWHNLRRGQDEFSS